MSPDLAHARTLAASARLGGPTEYLRALLGVALAILDRLPEPVQVVEAEPAPAPTPAPAPPAAGKPKGKRVSA
jgi:hypothetical protein